MIDLLAIVSTDIHIELKYIKTPDKADILHAATCLQTGAILITNDRHFDKIRDEGVIEVWNVSKAIRPTCLIWNSPARRFISIPLAHVY